jgi:hypothetical protein
MMADQGTWRQLLDTAKNGRLSAHELDQVVAAIKDPDVAGDRYTLLHIIGRSMDSSYENLVASYLDYREDPMLARLALQILGSYWGKIPQYMDYVRRFLRGVDWDTDGDVRQIAISIAGEFLRKTWNEGLFHDLLDIAINEANFPEMRRFAIEALARAMGDDWDEIPPPTAKADLEGDWYRNTLDRAFQRFVDKNE